MGNAGKIEGLMCTFSGARTGAQAIHTDELLGLGRRLVACSFHLCTGCAICK